MESDFCKNTSKNISPTGCGDSGTQNGTVPERGKSQITYRILEILLKTIFAKTLQKILVLPVAEIRAAKMRRSRRGANPRLHIRNLKFSVEAFFSKIFQKKLVLPVPQIRGAKMGRSRRGANRRLHIGFLKSYWPRFLQKNFKKN